MTGQHRDPAESGLGPMGRMTTNARVSARIMHEIVVRAWETEGPRCRSNDPGTEPAPNEEVLTVDHVTDPAAVIRERAAAAAGLLRHLKDPCDDAHAILWGIRRHLDRIEAELEQARPF